MGLVHGTVWMKTARGSDGEVISISAGINLYVCKFEYNSERKVKWYWRSLRDSREKMRNVYCNP